MKIMKTLYRRLKSIHAARRDRERTREQINETDRWWLDEAFMEIVLKVLFLLVWLIASIDCVVRFPWVKFPW